MTSHSFEVGDQYLQPPGHSQHLHQLSPLVKPLHLQEEDKVKQSSVRYEDMVDKVDKVDMVDTVDKVDRVDMVDKVDMVDMVDLKLYL